MQNRGNHCAKTIIITPLVSYCILNLNLAIAYLAFIVELRIVLKNPLNNHSFIQWMLIFW